MEIEVLRKHGFSLRRIAAEVGCAVNTVRSHLASGIKPKYERQKQRLAKVAPYETYLRERQAAAQPLWIPATVLHREISAQGYQGEPITALPAWRQAHAAGRSRRPV